MKGGIFISESSSFFFFLFLLRLLFVDSCDYGVFKGEIAGRVHLRVAEEVWTDPYFAWQGRAAVLRSLPLMCE